MCLYLFHLSLLYLRLLLTKNLKVIFNQILSFLLNVIVFLMAGSKRKRFALYLKDFRTFFFNIPLFYNQRHRSFFPLKNSETIFLKFVTFGLLLETEKHNFYYVCLCYLHVWIIKLFICLIVLLFQ